MRRHQDDEDRRVLRDGERMTVPLHMMDSMQRAIALQLHDGHGNAPGHRPGFVMSDATNDEREQAYRLRDEEDRNAWRRGSVRDARKVTQRDPSGRLMATFEWEPDDDEPYDASTLTLDEVMRDHQERMAEVYAAYDKALGERWRQP